MFPGTNRIARVQVRWGAQRPKVMAHLWRKTIFEEIPGSVRLLMNKWIEQPLHI